ncbi:MAG: fluoride efflux transporter CrcB [Candidatus Omnitrophica bacterium]|nr:fluoride efflux transporter CrcB [Candidatus Omnitrophota bacterium]
MIKWSLLFLAGGAGTILRYVLSGFVFQLLGARFPYGTLVINLLGCFLIGFLAQVSESKFLLPPNTRLFLMAGFIGAFTTFSTFIFETVSLIKDGQMLLGFTNVFLSVLMGFAVFYLGVLVGELI